MPFKERHDRNLTFDNDTKVDNSPMIKNVFFFWWIKDNCMIKITELCLNHCMT